MARVLRAGSALILAAIIMKPGAAEPSSMPPGEMAALSMQVSAGQAFTFKSFADATYDNAGVPGYQRTNWATILGQNGVEASLIERIRETGFNANVYYNRQTGQAVIAYAGSDNWADWRTTNIANNFGDARTPQYGAAALLAKLVTAQGWQTSCTGHSLGGGLCQRASIETGMQGVTFNSAPVGGVTDRQRQQANVFNYNTRGDPASVAVQGQAGRTFSITAPSGQAKNWQQTLAQSTPAAGAIAGVNALENHRRDRVFPLVQSLKDRTYEGTVSYNDGRGKTQTIDLKPKPQPPLAFYEPVTAKPQPVALQKPPSAAISFYEAAPAKPAQVALGAPSQTTNGGSTNGGYVHWQPPSKQGPGAADSTGLRKPGSTASMSAANPAQGGLHGDSQTIESDVRVSDSKNKTTIQQIRLKTKETKVNARATNETGAAAKVSEREKSGMPEAYRQQLNEEAKIREERAARAKARDWEAQKSAQAAPPDPIMEALATGLLSGLAGVIAQSGNRNHYRPAQGYPMQTGESCEQQQAREFAQLYQRYGNYAHYYSGGACLQELRNIRR